MKSLMKFCNLAYRRKSFLLVFSLMVKTLLQKLLAAAKYVLWQGSVYKEYITMLDCEQNLTYWTMKAVMFANSEKVFVSI